MTVSRWIVIVSFGLLLVIGCAKDNSDPGVTGPEVEGTATVGNGHPLLYTIGWALDGTHFQKIDTRTGRGTLGALMDASYGGTFGYAFDLDGTVYAMMNFYNGQNASVLTRVDMSTGGVTPVNLGQVYDIIFAGGDIDRHGNLYQTGFTVGPPEFPDSASWWGGYSLWRVNKATGELEEVGDTRNGTGGAFAGRWMDLAFDSQDRCWTTCSNKLFLLDTTDGHATFVTDITGVPQDYIPGDECPEDWPYMEVMDIAFDQNDVLWGSAIRGFSWCYGFTNAPVMRIDVNTGVATVVGYCETGVQNHGGDILPTRVIVAHRLPGGRYRNIDIPIEALPGHLAHGDYVPGTVGDPDYPR